MAGRDLVDTDYYLYGAGRAITWLRMSADALDDLRAETIFDIDQKSAEYHAYTGVSAARTALDALANWVNLLLTIGSPSPAIDFAKAKFATKIGAKVPALKELLPRLEVLAKQIDEDRQRAQHREGLAIQHYSEDGRGLGWYLCSPGRADRSLVAMLRTWADDLKR